MFHFWLIAIRSLFLAAAIALIFSFSPVQAESGIDSISALRILDILKSGIRINAPAKPKERPKPKRLQPGELYRMAKPYIGRVPYAWGGTSIDGGMDCSAFSRFIIKKYGVKLPRTVKDQARTGRFIPAGKLQPGDLVFFDATVKRRGVDHVGIYIHKGYFVHSHKPRGVRLENFRNYKYHLVFARRVL